MTAHPITAAWYSEKKEVRENSLTSDFFVSETELCLEILGDLFPPTLYGQGRVNPSQNLVDAFPMRNGRPISDANSGYDAKNPYVNRDPRLENYVL
ncbi:MAG: RagB/SusD family nutrient uptake outer membrane protein, partial [Ruminococcus sp.]|nr:RagB/SusD family nutrient uptake outer membrane protein [Ruminococcus sp.]